MFSRSFCYGDSTATLEKQTKDEDECTRRRPFRSWSFIHSFIHSFIIIHYHGVKIDANRKFCEKTHTRTLRHTHKNMFYFLCCFSICFYIFALFVLCCLLHVIMVIIIMMMIMMMNMFNAIFCVSYFACFLYLWQAQAHKKGTAFLVSLLCALLLVVLFFLFFLKK